MNCDTILTIHLGWWPVWWGQQQLCWDPRWVCHWCWLQHWRDLWSVWCCCGCSDSMLLLWQQWPLQCVQARLHVWLGFIWGAQMPSGRTNLQHGHSLLSSPNWLHTSHGDSVHLHQLWWLQQRRGTQYMTFLWNKLTSSFILRLTLLWRVATICYLSQFAVLLTSTILARWIMSPDQSSMLSPQSKTWAGTVVTREEWRVRLQPPLPHGQEREPGPLTISALTGTRKPTVCPSAPSPLAPASLMDSLLPWLVSRETPQNVHNHFSENNIVILLNS